jgi:hypothetical protein
MNQRQCKRRHLLKRVEAGKVTLKEAGEKLGPCPL